MPLVKIFSWASSNTRNELHFKAGKAELAFSQEGKSFPTLPSEAMKVTGACMSTGTGLRSPQGYGVGEAPASHASLQRNTRTPGRSLLLPIPKACPVSHKVVATEEQLAASSRW